MVLSAYRTENATFVVKFGGQYARILSAFALQLDFDLVVLDRPKTADKSSTVSFTVDVWDISGENMRLVMRSYSGIRKRTTFAHPVK